MKKCCTLLLIFFAIVSSSFGQENDEKNMDLGNWVNTIAKRITLSGYAQGGFNYEDQSSPKDEFKIARIVFMADAQVTDRIKTYFMYDLKGNSLYELWFSYKFYPGLNLKIGQFKTPFSMENPMSPTVQELICGPSLVTNYMIYGGNVLMMKGCGGRDLGVQLGGSLFSGYLDYNLAIMNGQGKNLSDGNSQKDYVAKLTMNPYKWISFSGSMIKGTGNIGTVTLNGTGTSYVSSLADITGLKANGNYRRDRYAVGAQIKTSPFCLRSEYMAGKDGDSDSKGYYATATVNNIGIKHMNVIGSYDYLDIYSGKSNRYSAGVEYWFLPSCRVQLGYSYKTVDGKHDENTIQTQLQVRF